jgi:hypothetical protein
MGTRGRKSSTELTTKAPLTVLAERRPSPPADLTEAEGLVWSDVVGCMPCGWLSKAQVPLLVAYCRHTARAGLLAQQLSAFDPAWVKVEGGVQRLDKLLAMAERETRALTACARSLRLTPQSQYGPRAAATAASKGNGPRPWDPI